VSGLSLPLSLAANQTTSFNVLFAPTTTGSLSGTVTVTSTASNSPTTIKLSGSGASAAVPAVNLSWTPSSSSYTGFDIYRGTVSGGPYTMINSSLTPAFTDNTVAASQTYYYVVTEIDSSGNQSNYSNQATAVVP
jgi:fibronectin type 3 domain-containing protein